MAAMPLPPSRANNNVAPEGFPYAIVGLAGRIRGEHLGNELKRSAFSECPGPGVPLAILIAMEFPALLQRVRAEFNEMPGLRLTPAQAARLLGLDPRSCERVINVLVNSAILRWTPDGSVVRTES